jgi:hypothetical protein
VASEPSSERGTAEPDTAAAPAVDERPPGQVRVASALVAVQGLATLGFAGYLAARARAAAIGVPAVLGEAGLFLLIGLALLAVARGLWRGTAWPRTPAIVVQILLLPLAYSLLLPSGQPVPGGVVAALVLSILGLLMCRPAKSWSLRLDDRRRRP